MDKRTILFVLLVGITFFGLNLFFGYQRDSKNREILRSQEAKVEKERARNLIEIQKRTAKLSDLPIVELYSNQDKKTVVAYGIAVEEGVLTIAWEDSLPDNLWTKEKKLSLLTQHPVKDGPVLFGEADFKSLSIAALPDVGSHDIQLVTFSENASPTISLGEIQEGQLSLLQGPLSTNAIVLYKGGPNMRWLPLAFYEWRGKMLIDFQNLPALAAYARKPEKASSPFKPAGQKYYVLENAYVQLVFSNVGGSLVEINLPFESEEDRVSVVKEIGFDRQIAKEYPANARFPAHPFYTPGSLEEHTPEKVGGYYPLLRRGIWDHKHIEISPQFYALNIVSEYPEMAELVYEVKEFTPSRIVFEAIQPHRKITKIFSLDKGSRGAPYCFNLSIHIEGDARGLWITSGIPEVEIMSNNSSPQIQYRQTRKGKSIVEKLDLPKVKEIVSISSIQPDWVVNSNGYLGIILDPLSDLGTGYKAAAVAGTQVPTRLSVIDPKYNPYPASKYPGYQILFPLPSHADSVDFRIYSGPFEESVLKAVDAIYVDPETGYSPNYAATWTFYGWFSFISEPFAKMLFVVMKFFKVVTGSWAFAIILLTVFLRLLLYPLNAWSIKSMRRMQQLSPQIQAIQAKHKKDPKKAQMEIMALYREKKVNPFTGCIPILIQIPFLIAMFDLLKSSFQLRGASFIPGWIDNLTAPDVLFQWKAPIFFIGNQFHLLPILLGGVMFVQQRFFSATPADPSKMTDQQRQQKAMGTIMTVVFAVMFYHFPSGLNIYWLSSMTLGIVQQWVMNKVLDKKKNTVEIMPSPVKKKFATKKAK
jgi:YidC/Oxa1 family membrane protein insertase